MILDNSRGKPADDIVLSYFDADASIVMSSKFFLRPESTKKPSDMNWAPAKHRLYELPPLNHLG